MLSMINCGTSNRLNPRKYGVNQGHGGLGCDIPIDCGLIDVDSPGLLLKIGRCIPGWESPSKITDVTVMSPNPHKKNGLP